MFEKNPLQNGVSRNINEYSQDLEDRVEDGFEDVDTDITELKKPKAFAQVSVLPATNLTISSTSSTIISGIPEIEIDVSKDNTNIYLQVIMLASVNIQVGNIIFFVDGTPTGRANSTNQQTETTLNTVHIVKNMSKGKHKFRVGAYTQSTSSTLTIRSYNSIIFLAYEI